MYNVVMAYVDDIGRRMSVSISLSQAISGPLDLAW
jgi:hypothetical protein